MAVSFWRTGIDKSLIFLDSLTKYMPRDGTWCNSYSNCLSSLKQRGNQRVCLAPMPSSSSQLRRPLLGARWLQGSLSGRVRCLKRGGAEPLRLHPPLPRDNDCHPRARYSDVCKAHAGSWVSPLHEKHPQSCGGGAVIMEHAQGFGETCPTNSPPEGAVADPGKGTLRGVV